MARRRVIDWQKVKRFLRKRVYKIKRRPRPLGWPVKLTWFGVLAAADDFGLGEWSAAEIGMIFMADEIEAGEITIPEISEIMDSFTAGEDPSVLTWEQDDRLYFALPKYQNYQRTHSPSNADVPCPPSAVFAKLSDKTQAIIRKNRDKFTTIPEGLFCPEVEEEGEVEGE
ncbi:MAG: hypothetical protein JXC32_21025, partial [Anaerolineae bacterium]|nr:hypothetical protein [Anaerolineae bacterium]